MLNRDVHIHELPEYNAKDIFRALNVGKFIGNFKCHLNCYSYYLKHKEKVDKILGCLQVYHDHVVVAHFVIKLNNGNIVDPTYGNLSSECYSYLTIIEEYNPESFKPERELILLKEAVLSKLPFYKRLYKSV